MRGSTATYVKEFPAKADKPLGLSFALVNMKRITAMQPTNDSKTQPGTQPETHFPAELGLTMTRILKNPLAALRASMENLAHDLPVGDPHFAQVNAALEEVVRLSRGVQDLVDFAAPREIQPLSCTTEEILFSTLRMLPETTRARVQLARPGEAQTLRVDGPQLCQALRHLADYALATTAGEVLFGARHEFGAVLFTLVGEASKAASNNSIHLDLGLHLAGRDVPRLGGTLNLQRSARGATCIQVSFPLTQVAGARA